MCVQNNFDGRGCQEIFLNLMDKGINMLLIPNVLQRSNKKDKYVFIQMRRFDYFDRMMLSVVILIGVF